MQISEWGWEDFFVNIFILSLVVLIVYAQIAAVISKYVYKRGVQRFSVCTVKKNGAKGSASPFYKYRFKVKGKIYKGSSNVPLEFNLLDRDVKGNQYIVAFIEKRPRFNKIIEFTEVSKYNLSPPPDGWAKRDYIPVPVDKTQYTINGKDSAKPIV